MKPIELALLAPRYWPGWIGLALLRAVVELPQPARIACGRQLGRLMLRLAGRRRRIARRNLELCFTALNPPAVDRLLHQHFESLGISLIESAMSWWLPLDRIEPLIDYEGLEALQRLQADGNGVVLVSGHFEAMELGGQLLARQIRMGAMYRPLKNRLMDPIARRGRGRYVEPLFPRDQIRTMARALRNGGAVWYGFDQNYGTHSLFIDFFGVPAATITTTSRLAAMGRALVVPFFPYRQPNGRYRLVVGEPLDHFPSADPAEDTRRLNQLLEEAIMVAPEQYLWIHRRFKSRPPGEAPLY
jgi:KDO2-lipid IV(A) lauroyltransferase